jgi:hypothetical protein
MIGLYTQIHTVSERAREKRKLQEEGGKKKITNEWKYFSTWVSNGEIPFPGFSKFLNL